jgi:hypothetical protein
MQKLHKSGISSVHSMSLIPFYVTLRELNGIYQQDMDYLYSLYPYRQPLLLHKQKSYFTGCCGQKQPLELDSYQLTCPHVVGNLYRDAFIYN